MFMEPSVEGRVSRGREEQRCSSAFRDLSLAFHSTLDTRHSTPYEADTAVCIFSSA